MSSVIGVENGGQNAVHMVALIEDTKDLSIGDAQGRPLLGMSLKNAAMFQYHYSFIGFLFLSKWPTGMGAAGGLFWKEVP